MMKLRILLTDDHTLFRQGLKTLLEAEYDMQVVGEAQDGTEAVAKAAELKPDLVLMDIGMPGLASFEAVRQIRKQRPETKAVFLSMYDDEDYLQQCLEAGASGYLLKDSPADQLIGAIREVRRGGKYLSPRILSKLVEDISVRNPAERFKPRLGTLTPRERETLKFLAEGLSVKEIAVKLQLSTKTVEAHKFNLMRKLDIHNKAHLVRYAIERKIINIA
ncbi:MAG TPA: response regulator transcription factor [Terriglobales bacterium]|nr:response regulator transcription factor [Terriglobales bacterium]